MTDPTDRELTALRRIAEATRAWYHGNCSGDELIRCIEEFEAELTDEQLAAVEASRLP